MKHRILVSLLLVTRWAAAQILNNGGFESGLAGWSTNVSAGATATFNLASSPTRFGAAALRVAVTNAGSASNAVQLVHTLFSASATNTYVLRFWASSDVLRASLGVNLLGATPAYPQIAFQISTNNNSYQEYLYAFRGCEDIAIAFNFQTVANYWLDGIEILDVNNTNGWDVPLTYLWQWGQLAHSFTNTSGWTGGDNNKSVLLPDGSVAWMFNDSFQSKLNFYSNVRGGVYFPRNYVVHQIGTNLFPKIVTSPASAFFIPTNTANLYWIGDCLVESNKVKVLLSEINATSITRVGTAIGTLSLPGLDLESIATVPSPGADDYNQVVNGNDGYYYVYWTTNTSTNPLAPANRVHVARTPVGQLAGSSAWNYWNGATWTTNHLLVAPVPGLISPWSVAQLGPSNYAAVYMPALSLTIHAQFASSPLGPWTPTVPIFQTDGEWDELNYMPNICAGTESNGGHTIGYSDNGTEEGLSKWASDRSWYSPHFVKANLRRLSPYTPFVISTNYRLTGTIIGTAGIGSSTIDKAFDGNLATFFDANGVAWVGVDLGAGNQKVVTTIRYAPRTNYASRMVGGVFQGARVSDFSDAVTLYTIPLAPMDGFLTTITFSNGTPYRYVRYLGAANSYCNVSELEFYGAVAPSAPAFVSAVPGDHQLILSWSAVTDATAYNLKRASSFSGPFNLIQAGITNLSFTDTGLLNGTTYFYQVAAVTWGVEGTNSVVVSATPNGAPTPPTGFTATAGTNHTVTLNWTRSSDATGYVAKRGTNPLGPYAPLASLGGETFTDTETANGTVYYYVIAATNAFGTSADSQPVRAQPGGYESWVRAAGAISYWPLDETNGSTARDSIGGNHGTYSGGVGLGTDGVSGDGFGLSHPAAQFNGVNSYVQIPLVVGSTNFTITFWCQTAATGGTPNWYNGQGLIDGEVAGVANDFGTALVGGKVALGVGNSDTTLLSVRALNDGAWHFVAASRNSASGSMMLFLDGILDATRSGPTGARAAAPNLRIGSLQTAVGGGFFNGKLSDVAVFSQTMDAAQVGRLFKAGAGLFYDAVLTNVWDGTNCSLSWLGGGKLMEAADLTGPWTINALATSPHLVSPIAPRRFYRLVVP